MERWSDDDNLMLLTIEEINNLPGDTEVTSINGDTMLCRLLPEGLDTRYGVTAWGLADGRAEFVLAVCGTCEGSQGDMIDGEWQECHCQM